jgi:hypothetical protein
VAAPTISDTMKRTCDNLRQGATKQVTDYEQRFSILKDAYDDLLANLIKAGFNQKEAWETAKEFFSVDTVRFAGVDGTMYSKPLFDMVIFFGGAYAATGTIKFTETAEPQVEYDAKTIQQNVGLSSVVPMYINEIPDVDISFSAQEQPSEVNPSKPATDEEIANNSLIANVIMTFSECYLAYKLAVDPEQNIKVLLMDRSLSTERASLLYETRKTDFWDAKSTLVGYNSEGRKVDRNDLAIARQHVCNQALGLPAPRGDYLRYAIICLAEQKKTFTLSGLLNEFKISDEKRRRRVEKALSSLVTKRILTDTEGVYALNNLYVDSWERTKRLTIEIGDKLFFTKNPSAETSSSMKIMKDDKEYWLTTLDIAFLTLFSFQMLMEECWRKRILLVGVTKDTSAMDFKRQLVPIMQNEGLLKATTKNETLAALPNTDRMILQSASVFNPEKVTLPWSLIEYDSAFRTMQPDSDMGQGYVKGVIKNKISLEKAFLKTYVQLSQAKSDPLLRSNVLLIDRLAYEDFDPKPECRLTLWNEMSDDTKEPVEVLLFKDKSVPNRMQNLVMSLLVAMAPANIPEAFGHNKALFVADKIAKWNYSQFKCVVDSTANWLLNNHKLRKFIFYMSTFRERRANIEQARRQNP